MTAGPGEDPPEASLDAIAGSAPEPVRRMIDRLRSTGPLARGAVLEEAFDQVLRDGSLTEMAPEALPALLAVGTAPRHPEAAGVLVRLLAVLAAIDDPPRSVVERSVAGRATRPRETRCWAAFRRDLSRLLHVARTSRNPEACRAAACICARFPEVDADVEPVVVALLSGMRDPDERARLLHALARIQATRGGPFHRAVLAPLDRPEPDAETVAVLLALAEHDLPDDLRTRFARAVERARRHGAALRVPDPRTWGERLPPRALDELPVPG